MEQEIANIITQVGVGAAALLILFFAIRGNNANTKSLIELAAKLSEQTGAVRDAVDRAAEMMKETREAVERHDERAQEIKAHVNTHTDEVMAAALKTLEAEFRAVTEQIKAAIASGNDAMTAQLVALTGRMDLILATLESLRGDKEAG